MEILKHFVDYLGANIFLLCPAALSLRRGRVRGRASPEGHPMRGERGHYKMRSTGPQALHLPSGQNVLELPGKACYAFSGLQ